MHKVKLDFGFGVRLTIVGITCSFSIKLLEVLFLIRVSISDAVSRFTSHETIARCSRAIVMWHVDLSVMSKNTVGARYNKLIYSFLCEESIVLLSMG